MLKYLLNLGNIFLSNHIKEIQFSFLMDFFWSKQNKDLFFILAMKFSKNFNEVDTYKHYIITNKIKFHYL